MRPLVTPLGWSQEDLAVLRKAGRSHKKQAKSRSLTAMMHPLYLNAPGNRVMLEKTMLTAARRDSSLHDRVDLIACLRKFEVYPRPLPQQPD
jgi:hypothetical protein